MRAHPVAVFAFGAPDLTTDLAVKTARATHTHEDAVQGAQLFALAVGHVLHQVIVSSFEVDGFLDYLQDNFQGTSYEDKLKKLQTMLAEARGSRFQREMDESELQAG